MYASVFILRMDFRNANRKYHLVGMGHRLKARAREKYAQHFDIVIVVVLGDDDGVIFFGHCHSQMRGEKCFLIVARVFICIS